eukprot:TRINITY_DN5497_c0_g1_i1.p1 TRINITY_DN5497_c0_g1~~TRINITY_DN5497_c0_g1_i1.p1  ORF type:complete len:1027 (+),score=172.70 TRINITY_DN5497_c0_g1_i1:228-3308(+)
MVHDGPRPSSRNGSLPGGFMHRSVTSLGVISTGSCSAPTQHPFSLGHPRRPLNRSRSTGTPELHTSTAGKDKPPLGPLPPPSNQSSCAASATLVTDAIEQRELEYERGRGTARHHVRQVAPSPQGATPPFDVDVGASCGRDMLDDTQKTAVPSILQMTRSGEMSSRLRDISSSKNSFVVLEPSARYRLPVDYSRGNSPPAATRSPSSSRERTLQSYRPAFRSDWLCALKRELIEGVHSEGVALKNYFAEVAQSILAGTDARLDACVARVNEALAASVERTSNDIAKASGELRGDFRAALELDAERELSLTSFGKRQMEVDFTEVLHELHIQTADLKAGLTKLGKNVTATVHNDTSKVVRESRSIATDVVLELRKSHEAISDLMGAVERVDAKPTVDLSPVLDALAHIDVQPVVNLDSIRDAIAEIDLSPILEGIQCINAKPVQPPVDLNPVLEAIAAQTATVTGLGESAAASHTESLREQQMRFSTLQDDMAGLTRVCEQASSLVAETHFPAIQERIQVLVEMFESLGLEHVGEALGRLEERQDDVSRSMITVIEQEESRPKDRGVDAEMLAKELLDVKETIGRLQTSVNEIDPSFRKNLAMMTGKIQDSTSLGSVTKSLKDIDLSMTMLEQKVTKQVKSDFASVSELVNSARQATLDLLSTKTDKAEVEAVLRAVEGVDGVMLNRLADVDKRHSDVLQSLLDASAVATASLNSVQACLPVELGRVLEAIAAIDVQPIVPLEAVLEEVQRIVQRIEDGSVGRGIARIEAKPDVDISPTVEAIAEASERDKERSAAHMERSAAHMEQLAELRDMMNSSSTRTDSIALRHGQELSRVHNVVRRLEERPVFDLSPALDAIADLDLSTVVNRAMAKASSEANVRWAECRDDIGVLRAEMLPSRVADDVTALLQAVAGVNTRSRHDQAVALEAIRNLDQRLTTSSPLLDCLKSMDASRTLEHREVLQQLAKVDTQPLSESLARLEAQLPVDLMPIRGDLKRVDSLCGAILSSVKGGGGSKNLLWSTPSAKW